MTFDPTTNRVPLGLLSEYEKRILMLADHGWQRYFEESCEWRDVDKLIWYVMNVYRAKPAPVAKSIWVNVYPEDELGNLDVSLSYPTREKVDSCASRDRIGVARFDLIDGVLSVELEPLENNNG